MNQVHTSSGTGEGLTYVGKDLEAMSCAENYRRWIVEIFAPHLGRRVVEVGAGKGAFSELILEHGVESLSLVEPSPEMFRELRERVEGLRPGAVVETYNTIFTEAAPLISASVRPDTIIYINVLEHVADDVAELELMRHTLADGGRAFVFVPALGWLYGSFDRQIGHHRRYSKRELEEKCRRAGLRVLDAGYLDLPGVLPWWVKYRLLRSETMEAGAVKLYDKFCVPLIKTVETRLRPPIGKNIFLVAEKA